MRIGKYFSFLVLLFVVSGCQKNQESLPLPEDKLVAVLGDLHLAEGAFQNLSTSAKDTLAYMYYEQVYEIHEVEKWMVDSSIAILNRHPEVFEKIYEKVEVKLAKENAELRKERPKNRNLPGSDTTKVETNK